MATATKKARAMTGANPAAKGKFAPSSMEFLVVEDNGGKYHWTLLDRERNCLALSPRFVSYEQAEDAAGVVLAGAAAARLDRRAANGSPPDVLNTA